MDVLEFITTDKVKSGSKAEISMIFRAHVDDDVELEYMLYNKSTGTIVDGSSFRIGITGSTDDFTYLTYVALEPSTVYTIENRILTGIPTTIHVFRSLGYVQLLQ